MPQRKSHNSKLPTSDDGDSQQTICQNCNTPSYWMQYINIWKQTHSYLIDHLTGWPEAFPILDKSADTIVSTFINKYLPVHMCPRYILSDNFMDHVLKQLGIERIFSAPYHPQSNGKSDVFHKYLKPALKKLCEKDKSNWDNILTKFLPATESHLT